MHSSRYLPAFFSTFYVQLLLFCNQDKHNATSYICRWLWASKISYWAASFLFWTFSSVCIMHCACLSVRYVRVWALFSRCSFHFNFSLALREPIQNINDLLISCTFAPHCKLPHSLSEWRIIEKTSGKIKKIGIYFDSNNSCSYFKSRLTVEIIRAPFETTWVFSI